jgi:hypothetical protein
MRPVIILSLPHNHRLPLYQPGEAPDTYGDPADETVPDTREWASLPIPMPRLLTLTTDHQGRVIAGQADGRRIRWRAIDIVVEGVQQFNADCARLGIVPEPVAPYESLPTRAESD